MMEAKKDANSVAIPTIFLKINIVLFVIILAKIVLDIKLFVYLVIKIPTKNYYIKIHV